MAPVKILARLAVPGGGPTTPSGDVVPADGGRAAEAPIHEPDLVAVLERFGIAGGVGGLPSHPDIQALIGQADDAPIRQAVFAEHGLGHLLVTVETLDDGSCRLTIGLYEPKPQLSGLKTELETLLQDVIDWVPATLSIKDTERRYLFVNRYWETFAGISRERVIGRRFEDLTPTTVDAGNIGRYGGDIRDRDQHVLTTGAGIHNHEEHYIDRTGDDRTLLNNRVPLFRPDGELLGVLSITMDITERKRKEDELVEAKDLAEAGDRAKSRFLSVMSHELRTPMQSVLGLAQLGAHHGGSGTAETYFQSIEQHARALDGLIAEILEFSRLEGGEADLDEYPFDPRALVEDAVAVCCEVLSGKPIAIESNVDRAVPEAVIADRGRLRQTLLLLLRNAVKFTDAGRIHIRMSAETATASDHSLRIEIEDTGAGIPADRLNTIFDPFSQADSSESRHHDGIGLGLSIGRRLVQSMGGEIGVDSRPGDGSRFWIAIPAKAVIPSPS